MFDRQAHNDSDLLMKTILEGGREEVPAHIWEGVSSKLDAIAQRRSTVLLWRRATVGMSAAAAIAAILFFAHPSQNNSVDAVAEQVVEQLVEPVADEEVSVVISKPEETGLLAMAPRPSRGMETSADKAAEVAQSRTESQKIDIEAEVRAAASAESEIEGAEGEKAEVGRTEVERSEGERSGETGIQTSETEVWVDAEEEVSDRKVRTSIVLSGIAGTNSAQNAPRAGVIRRPTVSAAPVKTRVSQTEPGDIFGIPLSFGIGTKIDFTPKWSLGVGVNYSLLNRKFYGDYIKVENGKITENIKSDIRNYQHYVGIPLNAYYNIVENRFVNFYTYAGGTVEKCVLDEYRVVSKDIVHKESVKGVQLSADLGIGVEFMLGKHLGIYIDPSVRYYFNCNQPKSIRTEQPLMLGFEMGLRARL